MRNNMSSSTNEIPKRDRDNRGKAKSPSGWMAFDLKQRRKQQQQGLQSDHDSEAYPVLSGPTPPKSLAKKIGASLKKPFSSVLAAPKDFPSLMDMNNIGTGPEVSIKDDYQQLNFFDPFGDESLIDDILGGVNNNVDEALSLIEAMFNSENKDVHMKKTDFEFIGNDFRPFDTQGNSLVEKSDVGFITCVPPGHEASSVLIAGSSKSLPIEPEWEEDDVYLIHRKDAMKATRSASHHSKAANDAYIKGDHISAQRYSRMAKEEWIMAKKLNAKAAKEILSIRNRKNDLWTLDLHGLHALEAVDALRDRLQTVESIVSSNSFGTFDGVHNVSGLHDASTQSSSPVQMGKFGRPCPSSRPRQHCLQVITGKGNHSKGAAALPSAIRNFLNENGYHFDETRPGSYTVHPKFRKR